MFELKVKTHFSAAHKIVDHPGKCGFMHGHNWDVYVTVQSDQLDRIGIAVDFKNLKALVKEVIEPLDHTTLNDHTQFNSIETNPTAENLSRYVFGEIRGRLRQEAPHARLVRVDIFETDTCSASYFE